MTLRLLLLTLLLSVIPGSYGMGSRDWDNLRRQVQEMELAPTLYAASCGSILPKAYEIDAAPIVTEKDLADIDKLFQADGTFADIDYEHKGRSQWRTARHLDYCRILAISSHFFPESIQKKYKVRSSLLTAFDWWLENTPSNPNWWNNDVYVCQMVGNIALLLNEKDLTSERRKSIEKILGKSWPRMTGQNLMWLGWNSFLASILTRDEKRLEEFLCPMMEAITIASQGKEGIQPDMSFHQHGSQFMQGNYGRHFIHSASKLIRAVSGTKWESPEKTLLIEKYMLDGTQWMCSGSLMDYSVLGRQITYPHRVQGPDLIYACLNLSKTKLKRQNEFKSFFSSLNQIDTPFAPGAASPAGTRAFPLSDYAVHREPGQFMTTVKMSSTRTIVGEMVNGDNLKGCYLSDGCMMTYTDGTEYKSIFPCWDWTCIPGTTTRKGYLPSADKWSGRKGGNSFAGALDGGVAAMISDRFGLTARKSWFFLEDRIVCMGSGITLQSSTKTQEEIITTVEQSLDRGWQEPSRIQDGAPQALTHGHSLYVFAPGTKWEAAAIDRKGTWKDICRESSDEPQHKKVFQVTISHGEKPLNAQYIYHVFPHFEHSGESRTPEQLFHQIIVLKHDSTAHAVSIQNELRIVFFEAGECPLPDNTVLKVNEPCLLACDAKRKWTAAIPGKREGKIKISIGKKQQEIPLTPVYR